MKSIVSSIVFLITVSNLCFSQTGWVIQPSFTPQNLYDCKLTGSGYLYICSDSGRVYRSAGGGANWTLYNFNDTAIKNSSLKFLFGSSNDDWFSVGQDAAYAYRLSPVDSVSRITNLVPVPSLESFSRTQGLFFYQVLLSAGEEGNFFMKDGSFWRKDTAAMNKAAGKNINYSTGNYFVGDSGLIMKADSIGYSNSNGEKIKWRILPSGTTKNLNSISAFGMNYIAVGDDGIILKSTNFGETWTSVQSPTTENLYAVWTTLGYLICGANGTILRCYDQNFDKWYIQNSNTTKDLYFAYTLGYQEFLAGGKDGIFLKTTDGGGTLKNISLSLLIEGFYNPASNLMISDTVKVTIRESLSPYSIVDSVKGIINSSGNSVNIVFGPKVLNSVPYYIQINHRNSIETWSKTPQTFSSNQLTYSFYSASNKAYGDNQTQVDQSPVRFAIFSGDVNQDGNTDVIDLGLADNDALNFITGYVNTDVNGNNVVDANDLSIIDNNAFNFVAKVTPP